MRNVMIGGCLAAMLGACTSQRNEPWTIETPLGEELARTELDRRAYCRVNPENVKVCRPTAR